MGNLGFEKCAILVLKLINIRKNIITHPNLSFCQYVPKHSQDLDPFPQPLAHRLDEPHLQLVHIEGFQVEAPARGGALSSAIAAWLRQTYGGSKEEDSKSRDEQDSSSKRLRPALRNFFDNLVLTSEHAYLDTIGFQFSLIDDVDRFLELASFLAFRAKLLKDHPNFPTSPSQLPASCSREQLATSLAHFVLETIRLRSVQRDSTQVDLQEERMHKRLYGTFWAGLSPEQKQNFLLLGSKDTLDLHEQLNLDMPVRDLEKELRDLFKLEKNDFCNRLLKCKLRRCNDPIKVYYRRLFDSINEHVGKKERKIRRIVRRTKTTSFSSNDTNETDIEAVDRFTDKIAELTRYKLELDLEEFGNILSEKANKYFKHREIAFNRIQYILQPYRVGLHLFGSCCNGIALEKSDVDIAIGGNILSYFPYGTIKERTAFALESVNTLLQSKKWIVSSKPILTAAIPVLKLQINASGPMDEPLPMQLREQMEVTQDHYKKDKDKSQNQQVVIHVDLTVDTRGLVEPENCHLGIRSTELIGEWLTEINGLYSVLILLKHMFWRKSLSATYKGGLSPYCLLVMIKAYLHHTGLKDPLPSELLQGFLKFYGNEFDERRDGVDIRNSKQPFYTRELNQAKIEVKDPLNGRVMTRNAYLYGKIKQELLDLKARCFDELKLRVRQHLMGMHEENLQEAMELPSQKYFTQFYENFPKNVFSEYEFT